MKLKSVECLVLTFVTVLFLQCSEASIMTWIFGSGSNPDSATDEEKSSDHATSAELVSKSKAKFEMKTADDNFLALSQFTKDLSPLDVCHHTVIAELTSTCGDLSEEELGKLAVQLLNCQSQAEGRRVYSCTAEMTIGDCTRDMDAVTWNAYQIVSNRARAVCYSTRQHQFRMKTEFTVNKLVHTTQGQLDAISQIQDDHENLKAATKTTLEQVHESQKDLSEHQRQMTQANKNVNAYIVGNIKELTREKALIASGNRELAAMAEGLKEKLEEATDKILEQGNSQKNNHEEILSDLASIRERAREVWEKIDNSSKDMIHYRDETKEHYRQTLENLQRVNHTIAYLEATLHNTRAELESKLDWLLGLVGGTGDRVALLSTLFLHTVYLLLGALSSTFLQTPRFSRLLLLLLVPLNAWSQIQTKKSLAFIPMTMFIVLTVTANWLMCWIWYLFTKNKGKTNSLKAPAFSPTNPRCTSLQNILSPQRSFTGDDAVRHDSQGLSSPDLHRLVNILETMYNSGILRRSPKTSGPMEKGTTTPGRGTPALTNVATPLNPPPTPNTCSVAHRNNDMSIVRRQLIDRMESASTSTPVKGGSPVPSHCSTPIRLAESVVSTPVKKAIINDESTPEKELSRDISTLGTPSGRIPRTPRTPKIATPKTGRPSTPNRSSTRALCLATTLSGMPCKLASMDGSAFCHRHQVAK